MEKGQEFSSTFEWVENWKLLFQEYTTMAKKLHDESLKEKEPTLIIKKLKKAVKLNPTLKAAYFDLGRQLQDLKRFEEAKESYLNAIKVDVNYKIAYNNLGNIYLYQKQYELALQQYQTIILKIDPNYINGLYNTALTLIHMHRLEEAIEYFSKAIVSNPKNPLCIQSHIGKAEALRSLNRYNEAMEQIEFALNLSPNNFSAINEKGSIYRLLKQYKESIECHKKAIEIDPKNVKGLCDWAITLFEMKKYTKSIALCKKAIELNPTNSFAYCHIGESLLGLKKYEKSIKYLQKSLTFPGETNTIITANHTLGNVYFENTRFEDALNQYYLVNEIDPTFIPAINNICYANIMLKNYDVAEEKAKNILQNSSKSLGKFYYAYVLYKKRKYDEALECINLALKLDENGKFDSIDYHHAEYYYCCARIMIRLKMDSHLILEKLNSCIEKEINYCKAYFKRALIYTQLSSENPNYIKQVLADYQSVVDTFHLGPPYDRLSQRKYSISVQNIANIKQIN